MFLDFVATAAAAFAAAGVLLFAIRILKVRLPKWIIPVSAGAAMLGYAIWSEYSWFPRVVGALPDTLAVAQRKESSAPWRPWSYAFPMTDSFIAIDRANLRRNPSAPGQLLGEVLVITRWQGTVRVPVLFDCAGMRRADLIDGAEFDADGQVVDPDWRDMPADDVLLATACAEV